MAVGDENTTLAVDVVPGQAHDAPLLLPILAQACRRAPNVDEVVGDKGFDGDVLREQCLERDVDPQIPLRSNRDQGKWECKPEVYRERNRVERLLGKAKEFRRIATRYDKLKATYLGMLHLVLGLIRLRNRPSVNTA